MRIKTFENFVYLESDTIKFIHDKKEYIVEKIVNFFKNIYKNYEITEEYYVTVLKFKDDGGELILRIEHKKNTYTVYIYINSHGEKYLPFFVEIFDQTFGELSSKWCYFWFMWGKKSNADEKIDRIDYNEYRKFVAKKQFDL